MDPTFVDALPFAIGIALSPFPIVPVILLLLSPRARVVGPVFWLCFAAGVAVVTAVFVVLSEAVDFPEHPPTWASWTRIVVGLLLVALAIKQWLGRSHDKETPGWLATLQQAGPATAARYGFLLSAANPKVLVLAAGGGLVLGAVPGGAATSVALILAFTVVAAVAVAVPVVLYLLLGDRMVPPLRAAEEWLQRHTSSITAIVIGLIGVIVALEGFRGL